LVARVREQAAALKPLPPPSPVLGGLRAYDAPFSRQLSVLTRRQRVLLAGQVFTKVSTMQNIGLMLVAALLWVQLALTEQEVVSRWGLCLWMLGTWMFFPLFGSIGTFAANRNVLEKELGMGCYSLMAFYISRTILLIPIELAWPAVWTTGVFWISNANPDPLAFVCALALVFLSFCVFQGIGLAISASAMPPSYASTVSMIMITFFFGWSGFFADMSHLPAWLGWLPQLNAFKYGVELMVRILLPDDMSLPCAAAEEAAAAAAMPEGCLLLEDGSWALSGGAARKRHKITADPLVSILVLIGTLLVFRCLAFLLLRRDLHAVVHGAGSAQSLPASSGEPQAEDAPSANGEGAGDSEGARKLSPEAASQDAHCSV